MLTVGHSNRSWAEFLDLLKAHRVKRLVDVRKMPQSRYNPQFNRETLVEELGKEGIAYEHMPELGGLRRPRKDSPNTGWRNDSFRGYADYMQTKAFAQAIETLRAEDQGHTAIMCAEAVPWQCHRLMIADALVAHGLPVAHIMSATKAEPHRLTSFARIQGTQVRYPSPELELFGEQ
jgi:uncharacterized protein (DUF488 family)